MNKTIRVYGWNPITKEPLQGEFYADESPLDDDVYHLPQYTTKKPVPILTEHACALYDEASDDWLIVPDYRGETLYSKADGEPFVIEKLGDIPENLTFLARPSKAHDWDGKQWVLNQAKQSELDAAALAAAKSAALAAAVRYADELQAAILGETSPAAQARLMGKYTAAVAIKRGADTAGDHAVIDAEVMLRDKYTKAELINVIIAKGTAAKQAEGTINGMLLLAQDAFESAQTIEELGERVEAITAQADALKSKLLAAQADALKSKLLAAQADALKSKLLAAMGGAA